MNAIVLCTTVATALLLAVPATPSAATHDPMPVPATDALPTAKAFEPGHSYLLGRGAWTYFTDPRAVSVGDVSVTGWITPGGWVQVAVMNWNTGKVNVRRMSPRTGKDDHNNPAFAVRQVSKSSYRVTVFYSPHSGPGLSSPSGKPRLYYTTSTTDIRNNRWSRVRTVTVNSSGGLGYTYPNVVPLANNDLWVAWRGGNWFPTRSILHRGRWTKAKNLLKLQSVKSRLPQRPYVKYAAGKNGQIHMAYNQQHPLEGSTDLFYVSIKPRTDRASRADGKSLGRIPVPVGKADKVYSHTAHGRAWVMDVSDDGNGRPVIVYSTGWNAKRKVAFRYARWAGTRWIDRFVTWASEVPRARRRGFGHRFLTGGITIDHSNPNRLFVSRGVGRRYRVEVWQSDAANRVWNSTVVSPRGKSCFRPVGSVGPTNRSVVFFLCGFHKGWKKFGSRVFVAVLQPAT